MNLFSRLPLWLAGLFLTVFSVHSAEDKKTEPQPFVVGTASGYAPYVSLNSKGEYEGFDIDLAERLAQRLGKKLVIQDLGSMPSLLVALQKKKIDAIIWGMSITQSRLKEMEMIYYQGDVSTTLPFLFWKEVPAEVKRIEDLATLKKGAVCVESGSSQDEVLRKYPAIPVKYLDKIADALLELKYGKAAATTVDLSLLNRVQAQYPEIRVVHLPLPEDLHTLGNGICIHKDNQESAAQVRRIVQELMNEGVIAELEKKWGLYQF